MDFRIENMTCGGCAKSVTKAIRSVDPAARVVTNPEARMVSVETTATAAALQEVLEEAGYPATAN
ncbi:copper chaperone [Paracoccus halophilus]|uniref:Copper chaperone n=1 Tax=Paracoccus halophilus TaxID=376733 RepID=A0A099EWE1_9RHOB|nr:heavy-metal-associated domain-containing protein [Paracoccus halophilus]KGJ02326.1 heavy metal transport/detoxification protein [Paracoccus halophilus]SFA61299.1 copper chaperone [Paracoccus halophilus]